MAVDRGHVPLPLLQCWQEIGGREREGRGKEQQEEEVEEVTYCGCWTWICSSSTPPALVVDR